MKKILHCAAVSLLLSTFNSQLSTTHAQGTAFTYQGRLNNVGALANGSYDMQFVLYATNVTGTALVGPVTNTAVAVTNGLFTTLVDFGPGVFTGTSNWLAIAISTNAANAFTKLTPRQQLTPVPYALFANSASNLLGTLPAAQLSGSIPAASISGTIPLAQLPANLLTNGASGVTFSGTFSGNGAGVTNLYVPLSAVNASGAFYWPGNFTPASSPGVGNQPEAVAAADVNGDGKVDLISANGYDNTLTVLTNNGSGGFGFNATLTVGSSPYSVVAADINGDGKPDLISANAGDTTLTIFTNNGSGGFVLASTPVVGNGPISVVAADVNGDGKLDLISANESGSTLTVLTNNGSGGFVLAATLNVYGPTAVVAADVNGDGKPDLISASPNSPGTLTVFTNNGNGGFGYNATLNVGNESYSVTAADINGDGKLDLISANALGNSLTVLTNNGSGGFTLAATLTTTSPKSVVAADVNGDGKPDLICANYGGGTLTVFTNNGSGGFVLASSPGVGFGPDAVVAADVNGDGKPDLISANYGSGTLTVLLSTPAFSGALTGNGSGLTGLNAANLTGTIADARLSANVALRAGGNALTGNQTISAGNVGIGTATPGAPLHVVNGSSGVSAPNGGSVGAFESSGSGYVNLLTPSANESGILFGNSYSTADGGILYNSGSITRGLEFRTGGNANRVVITSAGNMGIGNFSPGYLLVVGSSGSPAYCNGTTWQNGSDRNIKEDFNQISPQAVLAKVTALPITEWQYKAESADTKHIGPMAQDFHTAFGLNGSDDKHISTVDEGGVALAAIQGLNEKLEKRSRELEAANEELKQRLDALEKLILSQKPN